ncbi:hypothetical protein [Actinobaculum suis]|uniref:hypothetical protein n=1 Tax=Actinobaculum suis TaxID=1657 RepID=UPI0008088158|nr:hypothetical protein [Actinobaculum suis]OCA94597.1 hypothetical protein ACU20_06530 [Actinobaculum suis]OCA95008.1 hypothetical protein ACU21_05315 [Actinobaculum suis]
MGEHNARKPGTPEQPEWRREGDLSAEEAAWQAAFGAVDPVTAGDLAGTRDIPLPLDAVESTGEASSPAPARSTHSYPTDNRYDGNYTADHYDGDYRPSGRIYVGDPRDARFGSPAPKTSALRSSAPSSSTSGDYAYGGYEPGSYAPSTHASTHAPESSSPFRTAPSSAELTSAAPRITGQSSTGQSSTGPSNPAPSRPVPSDWTASSLPPVRREPRKVSTPEASATSARSAASPTRAASAPSTPSATSAASVTSTASTASADTTSFGRAAARAADTGTKNRASDTGSTPQGKDAAADFRFDSLFNEGASTQGPSAPAVAPPKRRRFHASVWLVAAFAPIIALVVAFLVNLAAGLIGGALSHATSGANTGVPGGTYKHLLAAYSSLTTVFGLGGSASLTIDGASGISFNGTFYATALTTTAIIGLTLFYTHRWSGRGQRNSTLMVWMPAWLSAFVLAACTAGLAAFTRSDFAFEGITGSINPSPLLAAATAIPLGLFASGFGRLLTIRSTPQNRYLLTSASPIPTFCHGVAIAFAWFILSVAFAALMLGIFVLTGAGGQLADSSVGSRFSLLLIAFPYFLTAGAVALAGSLGGAMNISVDASLLQLLPAEYRGGDGVSGIHLIASGLPIWLIVVVVLAALVATVLFGVHWGRSRDPRLQYGPISWIIMPFSFTSVTAIIYGITRFGLRLDSSFGTGSVTLSANATTHWYIIFIGLLIGLLVEVVSRFARPAPPQTGATGYSAYGSHV